VIAAVATLALGIGANSAIFSVVNAVLMRPLPYPDPDRLVLVWERNVPRHQETNVVNPQNYLDWQDRAKSFSGLALLSWSQITFTGDSPEIISGRAVTPNFFDVIGMPLAMGRGFTEAEGLPGSPSVIVLSDGLWRRRFGADPGIVGRSVPVAGGTALVIGIAPAATGSDALGTGAVLGTLQDRSERSDTRWPLRRGGWSPGAGVSAVSALKSR
jgi:putative ABC transport system permease protein